MRQLVSQAGYWLQARCLWRETLLQTRHGEPGAARLVLRHTNPVSKQTRSATAYHSPSMTPQVTQQDAKYVYTRLD